MIETALGIIKREMNILDVPYGFVRWASEKPVPERYWIGEYTEVPTLTEDGAREYNLILTGTTKELWSLLMQDVAKIEDRFPRTCDFRESTEKGSVVIFYENNFPVPTGEANLKRIQVNLRIKAWKGMK